MLALNEAPTLWSGKSVPRRLQPPRGGAPSMKPRLYGRGNLAIVPGATRVEIPSMKPRLYGRGNPYSFLIATTAPLPSMKPRLYGRGNPYSFLIATTAPLPSMKPRLYGRGNGTIVKQCQGGTTTLNEAPTLWSGK